VNNSIFGIGVCTNISKATPLSVVFTRWRFLMSKSPAGRAFDYRHGLQPPPVA
jgi:hypothetical protein